jgi:putative transposase
MKIVVKIKLVPSKEQAELLLEYIKTFNAAATEAARVGYENKSYSQIDIHRLCYKSLREIFKIPSQTAVRAIGKAVRVFAGDRKKCPVFKSRGSATYEGRNFSIKENGTISISVLSGRIIIPYIICDYFADRIKSIKGQADLIFRNGMFLLHCTTDFVEPKVKPFGECIGIDLGITNIATDSDGLKYEGVHLEKNRKRFLLSKTTLQRRGTRSSRRMLKNNSGRQSRYQRQVNHFISKAIVAKAKALGLGISIEDLTGLKARCEKTVGRRQRSMISNWSYSHLRKCISYKAKMAGVGVVCVDPRNTSRTCFSCGFCKRNNRKTQSIFLCKACGYTDNADVNSAKNIKRLGEIVNLPHK